MSDNNEIQDEIVIHHLIVHKVDHKNYDQPVYADLETQVTEEVVSFIRQHIRKNRGHKNTSTAIFGPDPEDADYTVKILSDEVLVNNSLFISNTQRIAELLFKAQKTKNTSPGELVLCLFSEKRQPDRWLAILKMDPEDGFVGRQLDVNGQVQILLERVDGVLPQGELQKCAFVLPVSHRESARCDLVVLDQQQQNYGGQRQVASFFLHDFLNCVRELNRRDLTKEFYRHVNGWADSKIDAWEPETIEQLKEAGRNAIGAAQIDAIEFANQQFEDNVERDQFIDSFKERLERLGSISNLVFQPDPEISRRLVRYRTYEGDYGLRVRVEARDDLPDDLIEMEGKDEQNRHIVTLRTITWREL